MSTNLLPQLAARIPPLESGDRLTRQEFERRYDAMPDLKKAELIHGVVYTMPRVTAAHGIAHASLGGLLANYMAKTPGIDCGSNTTLRLLGDNEPQPDVLLMIKPECCGRVSIVDDFIEGPPELIGEVTASSSSYDLHDKFDLYREQGVQEYVVWRIHDRAIDWFRFERGKTRRLEPDSLGIIRSVVLGGLWMDVQAMLRDDMNAAIETLKLGLASPEHAAFVAALAAARK